MGQIRINSIQINNNRIEVKFTVSPELSVYFNSDERLFWVKYSEDIDNIPAEIAVIPFVVNVLPIVWVTNSELVLESIDKSFYDSISRFKEGYIKMYPNISFKGKITVNKIKNTEYQHDKAAVFFSGGVDAFSTLISHIKENPYMLTVCGADIALDDSEGWTNVKSLVKETITELKLPTPCYIKTNFTRFVSQKDLNHLVRHSGDGWWHGFQHGIGLIGLAAPLAYLKHLSIIYIASSYTKDVPHTCASDPTIDEYVRFGQTRVHHDQYEHSRQQKIQTIVNFCHNSGKHINLRVCYLSMGGENCGKCEKCLRTIFGLLAEGADPHDYGFNSGIAYDISLKARTQSAIKYSGQSLRCFWHEIQARFLQTKAFEDNPNINWIYKFDVYSKHSLTARAINKAVRFIRRLTNKHHL